MQLRTTAVDLAALLHLWPTRQVPANPHTFTSCKHFSGVWLHRSAWRKHLLCASAWQRYASSCSCCTRQQHCVALTNSGVAPQQCGKASGWHLVPEAAGAHPAGPGTSRPSAGLAAELRGDTTKASSAALGCGTPALFCHTSRVRACMLLGWLAVPLLCPSASCLLHRLHGQLETLLRGTRIQAESML